MTRTTLLLLLVIVVACALTAFISVTLYSPKPCATRVRFDESQNTVIIARNEGVVERDQAVLNDPLFPPVNRETASQHEALRNKLWLRPLQERDSDSFRLVAYLVSKSEDKTTWKLFGRRKDRNIGEFYATPSDRNNDVKVPLDRMSMPDKDARLRGMDDIPDEVTVNTPLLSGTFDVMRLPGSDFSTGYV
jgi:hypothetical protein